MVGLFIPIGIFTYFLVKLIIKFFSKFQKSYLHAHNRKRKKRKRDTKYNYKR